MKNKILHAYNQKVFNILCKEHVGDGNLKVNIYYLPNIFHKLFYC